jgi:hypothetical protein
MQGLVIAPRQECLLPDFHQKSVWEHLTYAMSINTYSSQKLENLQLEHKEK